MLRPTFLKASLENIALITSQAGHHADDLLEKRPAALPAPLKLVSTAPSCKKRMRRRSLAVEGVVGHH